MHAGVALTTWGERAGYGAVVASTVQPMLAPWYDTDIDRHFSVDITFARLAVAVRTSDGMSASKGTEADRFEALRALIAIADREYFDGQLEWAISSGPARAVVTDVREVVGRGAVRLEAGERPRFDLATQLVDLTLAVVADDENVAVESATAVLMVAPVQRALMHAAEIVQRGDGPASACFGEYLCAVGGVAVRRRVAEASSERSPIALTAAKQPEPSRAATCLLAGAVGDALGGPVEFLSLDEIRRRYGPGGTSAYDVAYGRRGAITDDTQMTLFTAEALIGSDAAGWVDALREAYLRWLRTQEGGGPAGEGLLALPGMHSRRAPGNTCLSALHATRAGARGTVADPINDSKGCGGVMRAAPAGLVAADPRAAFDLGCALAAITHGHPSGYLPAGVLAAAVHLLVRNATLPEALDVAVAEARLRPGHPETVDALAAARVLAGRGRLRPEDLESLGGGWTGEEALAIGVCAALVATDLVDGLLLAVNHSGDSDSTGALCGNLLGAGLVEIPEKWVEHLELRDVIDEIGRKLDFFIPRTGTPPGF